ncbi:carboxylate transporter [Rothia mucilaginosa]|uniref:carboxylate transporter n=1 Tax=Rothia mucilaginosa TaxID=43675 RepID=UPI0034D51C1D
MDLAALGLPMEQVRNVWLVAFFIYLACCLLVEVAYPTMIDAERARKVYISVMGSPIEEAKKKIEERAEAGDPLTPEQEEKAIRKAEAQLEDIKGSSVTMDLGHILLYAVACFITYATFVLYWYMVYEGNLIPALLLPFVVVCWAAGWGRRGWREARGFNSWDRHLGMPAIYINTLEKLSSLFRRVMPQRVKSPRIEDTSLRLPITRFGTGHMILFSVAIPASGFCLVLYLRSLLNVNMHTYVSSDIGLPSILLWVPYVMAALCMWSVVSTYYWFTLGRVKKGRFLLPAKVYKYSNIERFKVYPWYGEDTNPQKDMPSGWQFVVTFSDDSYETFGFYDSSIDHLIAHAAFKLEQERWADVDSPADRELLEKYFVEGRATCLTLGYKPTNELTEKAVARIVASYIKAD